MYRLRVVPAHGDPFDKALDGDSMIVGRSSECGLVIADRFLSRRHARLYREGDDWLVEDLGSRNGTLLNGVPVDVARPLREGDELQLSGSLISVVALPKRVRPSDSKISDISEHTIFRRASDLIDSQSRPASTASDLPAPALRYTERLRMLNDVHQALSRTVEHEELLELILSRVFEHLKPEEGSLFLRDENGEFYRAAFRCNKGCEDDYLYSSTLVSEVAEKGLAALVLDVEADERFGDAESILASGIRSLVAAPLFDPEGSLGMIALSSRAHKRRFSEDDMELLVALGSVAALRIRNVSLAEEAAERRRLEEELRLARQIQVELLPDKLPEIPGFALLAGNMPSRKVSGDYYQVVARQGGSEGVVMVSDVSGKGMAASILTASLEALTAGPIEVGEAPDRIFEMVSRQLFRRTAAEKYATAFLGVLRAGGDELSYSSAGHNPAILIRADGEVSLLASTGLPLGLLPENRYGLETLPFRPGDTLVVYTDGITEAADAEGGEYGLDRLIEVFRERRADGLTELVDALESDLDSFVDGVPFADDRTFLLVRRLVD